MIGTLGLSVWLLIAPLPFPEPLSPPPPSLAERVQGLTRFGEILFVPGDGIQVEKVLGYRPGEVYELPDPVDLTTWRQFCTLLGYRVVLLVGIDVSEATVGAWISSLEALSAFLQGGGCPG